ncbi:MAG TPA: NAD(P)H-hydrate dehydratase, partial [Spirochaetota bacterium]
ADIAMTCAGKGIVDAINREYKDGQRIAVVCGHGNNGGDGFAAGYFLFSEGKETVVFFDRKNKDKLSDASFYFFTLCEKLEIVKDMPEDFSGYQILIDCVLGTGSVGQPREDAADLIKKINRSGSFIISADIPSGLPSDGPVLHDCIARASVTVAMEYPKLNTLVYPGKKYSGNVYPVHVGFPDKMIRETVPLIELIDDDYVVRNQIKPFAQTDHKYSKGHLLILGGFSGMEGAALMAGGSAFATGAGLVTIMTEPASRVIIAGKIPEVMTSSFPEKQSDLIPFLEKYITEKKVRSVLIGSGLGRGSYAAEIFEAIASLSDSGVIGRTIVDGDALFHMSNSGWIPSRRNSVLLTPHVGESARLLSILTADIARDLTGCAIEISKTKGSTVVLKGSSTVIVDDQIAVWPGGSPELGTAGSGDVLAGVISSLSLRAERSMFHSAVFGVFYHAKSAFNSESGRPISKATDIIANIPDTILHYTKA